VTSLSATFQKRIRRNDIINLTVVEIMILMVFISLVFSFFAAQEGLVASTEKDAKIEMLERELNTSRSMVGKLEGTIQDLRKEIAVLQEGLEDRDRLIARLMNSDSATLSNFTVIPKDEWEKLLALLDQENQENKRLGGIVDGQQTTIAGLTERLQNVGLGTGLPKCPIVRGFLFEVHMLPAGMLSVTPAWEPEEERAALEVSGVKELLAAQTVPVIQFRQLGAKILAWGDGQKIKCRFHVKSRRSNTDLETYILQERALDYVFYWRRPD
jgi:hypothetical protein